MGLTAVFGKMIADGDRFIMRQRGLHAAARLVRFYEGDRKTFRAGFRT